MPVVALLYRSAFVPMIDKTGTFCVGSNETKSYAGDMFFMDGVTSSIKEPQLAAETASASNDQLEEFVISGGPACFGDSGGPSWTVEKNKPVQIGVFSYMLWGVCAGNQEPGYFVNLEKHVDWIHKYVPKEQTCMD